MLIHTTYSSTKYHSKGPYKQNSVVLNCSINMNTKCHSVPTYTDRTNSVVLRIHRDSVVLTVVFIPYDDLSPAPYSM